MSSHISKDGKMNRRTMLKMLGSTAAGIALASCAPAQPAAPTKAPDASKPTDVPKPTTAPPAKQPVTIVYHMKSIFTKVIDAEVDLFHKSQSDVTVKVEYTPDAELDTKLLTMAAGGQLGDAYFLSIMGSTYPFAASGINMDLNPLFDADKDLKKSDFFDVILKMATWEGKLTCMPLGCHAGWSTNWINTAAWEEGKAELPKWEWTFEKEWLDALKKVNVPGKRWAYIPEYNAQQSLIFIRSWGGDWIDPATRKKAMVDDPKTVAALRFMRDLVEVHKVAPRLKEIANSPQDMFINQLTSSYSTGIWVEGALKSTIADKFKWAASPMPGGPGGRGTFIGLDSSGINSKSKNPAATFQWLKWLATKDANVRMFAQGFTASALKKAWTEPPFSQNPNMVPTQRWLEAATPWTVPGNARVGEFRNAFAQGMTAILNPDTDFKAEIGKLQTAAQAVLDMPPV